MAPKVRGRSTKSDRASAKSAAKSADPEPVAVQTAVSDTKNTPPVDDDTKPAAIPAESSSAQSPPETTSQDSKPAASNPSGEPEWIAHARAKFAKEKPVLTILTPAYGGLMYVNYVLCFIETTRILSNLGVEVKLDMLRNESLITRARNNLTARAMADPRVTHVLWIDADITWSAIDVVKLLLSNHDMVGGCYVKKHLFWDRLEPENFEQIRKLWDPKSGVKWTEFLQHHLVDYNCNWLSTTNAITNNCIEVKHLATGFLMLSREWHNRMFEAYGEECKYHDDTGLLTEEQQKFAYGLYDTPIVDTHFLSEDWSICDKWRRLGGKVWLDVTISLNHTGTYDFVGRLQSKLTIT